MRKDKNEESKRIQKLAKQLGVTRILSRRQPTLKVMREDLEAIAQKIGIDSKL